MEQDLKRITDTSVGINFNPVSTEYFQTKEVPDHEPSTCTMKGAAVNHWLQD